jgi:hypothetical protein
VGKSYQHVVQSHLKTLVQRLLKVMYQAPTCWRTLSLRTMRSLTIPGKTSSRIVGGWLIVPT